MSVCDAVEASPQEILGNGIVLLRVLKGFDFEEMQILQLVVKSCVYFIDIVLINVL
jgi:hypothetical protein